MRTIALCLTAAGLLVAFALACMGCDVPPAPLPDAAEVDGGRRADTLPPSKDAPLCRVADWRADTAGNACDHNDGCDVGTASRCACHPPETTPVAAASVGARCAVPNGQQGTCCAWFSEAPFLLLWENCGGGWTCTGAKCPTICGAR